MAVFSLQEVKKLQVQNVTDNNFASWPESATRGYYGGGITPPSTAINTITRLDFPNETISNPGNNLPTARSGLAAVSNASYGYFGGGGPGPGYLCTITRLDFSNETVSNPGNNLPTSRSDLAATSSSSYGYYAGGFYTPPTIRINTITRLDFSNETTSDPGNNLPTGRNALAASSSSSYGYFGGGFFPYLCTITRLDFSNETVSDPGNNLPTARYALAAVSNASYGYYGGGEIATPPFIINTISRLDFFNETISDPGNNLPTVRYASAGTSSSSYGYFGGGFSPPYINTISRLDFFNETISDPGNNFPTARYLSAAVSGGASVARGLGYKTYGYWAGGATGTSDPTIISSIARQDLSTDVISIISSTLQGGPSGHPKSELGSIQSKNYGYFVGGDGPGTPGTNYGNSSHMTRLDFSNETTRFYPTWHSIGAQSMAGTQSAHYGYSAGGYSLMPSAVKGFGPAWLSTIDRVDFDTETTASPSNLRLTVRMSNGAAVESSDNAYFGGGYVAQFSVTDQVRKLNFATDTESTSPMTITGQIYTFAGASDNSYGFLGGGYNQNVGNRSQVDRLDFSTETITPNYTDLSLKKTAHSALSDTRLYGYYGGGSDNFSITCTISRLDFSTGTSNTHSPNFPTIRYKKPGSVTN
jgi:hypothetical protein